MIKGFRDKATATVFQRRYTGKLSREIQPRAFDKLRLLDAAIGLEDLKAPPGNRLESLKGDRTRQWSIRINAQWRVCFHWDDGHAWDVEITDYH